MSNRQIHQAVRQANDLDMRQANAVEARINLDLKIGAAFTRLTTMGLQSRIAGIEDKQVISYGVSGPRAHMSLQPEMLM